MKKELSSIDLLYIAKELQALVNAKLDKAYQVSRKELILQMHISGKGKILLRITPSFAYIAKQKPEMPEKVIGFCKILRKYLENARVKEISQIGSERILRIVFDAKDRKYILIAELFGGGNLIICDENEKIIQAAENKRMKEREIRGGVKYKAPSRGADLEKISKAELKSIIKKSAKDNISTTLAVDFGIGGVYAREICALAGVKENEKSVNDAGLEKIHAQLLKMLSKKPNPQIVYDDGKIADITPFEFKSYSGMKSKKMDSFSLALDSLPKEERKKKSKFEREIKGLEKTISKQESRIKELENVSSEMRKKGEAIYENYQIVKEILEELKKARNKYTWKEIKEKLKGHKTIKEVDDKDGKIVVDI